MAHLGAAARPGGGDQGHDGATKPREVAGAERARGRDSPPGGGAQWRSRQGASRRCPASPHRRGSARAWERPDLDLGLRTPLRPPARQSPGAVTKVSPSPAPLSERGAPPGPWGGGAPAFPARRPREPAPGAARAGGAGTQCERGLMFASPGAAQQPLAPTRDTGCRHQGCRGPQDPSRPGPCLPRPAHAPYDLGAGAGGMLWRCPPGPRESDPPTLRSTGEGGGEETCNPRPLSTSQTQPPAALHPLCLVTRHPQGDDLELSSPYPRGGEA